MGEQELFERAPIHKAYFKLALPVVSSMVLSLVYNMVDTFFIAQTQNTNLVAGVSMCAPIFTLMIALGDIFGLHMGAAGAAIATVLGTLCSDIVLIYFVFKKSRKLTVSCRNISITGKIFGSIMAIGIPASITNLMQSFGIALMNRSLVVYGTDKVAAMGIALKVNMIVVLVLVGFSFGGQPLIGYNYGAKNMVRMRSVIRFSLKFEIGLSVAAAILLAASAPYIIPIFMKEEAIITAGTLMMRCQLITMPCVAVVVIFTVVFQSAGKAVSAFVLSLSRQGVVLAVSMFVLSRMFQYYGVICAQALSDAVTAVIAVCLYIRLLNTELRR